MNSCIYNGIVTHTRYKPVKHHLKYKTFSLFLDLDEIEKLEKTNLIFSLNKFNIFSFYNKDHGERDGKSSFESTPNGISNTTSQTSRDIRGIRSSIIHLGHPRGHPKLQKIVGKSTVLTT